MLSIRNLRLTRGVGASAHRVSLPRLELARGDIMAITGSSGCGKSTLLEGIGLLLAPASVDAYSLASHADVAQLMRERQDDALSAIRAADLGFVLQSGGLLPYLNVRDNILLPRKVLGKPGHGPMLDHAISRLGLARLLDKKPSSLSIGERQRVAFVRAMAHEPSVILADEPTSALDPHNAQLLFELFLELLSEQRMAALVVSHDWQLIAHFGIKRLVAEPHPDRSTAFVPEAAACAG